MKTSISKYKERIRKFHNNEDGIEALQVVLIIAVAAILLVGIFKAVQWAIGYFDERGQEMIDEADSTEASSGCNTPEWKHKSWSSRGVFMAFSPGEPLRRP